MKLAPVILISLALVGCHRGPYPELEAAFGRPPSLSSNPIQSRSLVLISRRHEGAFNYPNGVEIRLAGDRIEIKRRGPAKVALNISAGAVDACGVTGWGDGQWDANLLISSVETQVSVLGNPTEILDWCWDNRINFASTPEVMAWMYEGKKLPSRGANREELASRAAYDEKIKQAKIGF